MDVAALLDAHFARDGAEPGELGGAFHEVDVPIHPNEHVTAAAERGDPERVRETGRWLARYGTDRCAVTVGLALLGVVGTAEDIPLIRTIGLLSNHFGALAARALERLPGGTDALLWLADRVREWGRVYVVAAICRLDDPVARPWLLRSAVGGDMLSGYYVGSVARAARLHEVMAAAEVDEAIVEHTGWVLQLMTGNQGMGLTLALYEHAEAVLDAHLRQLHRLGPSASRFVAAAWLTWSLAGNGDPVSVGPSEHWHGLAERYRALLDRPEWGETARRAFVEQDPGMLRLAALPQGRGLRAFVGLAVPRVRCRRPGPGPGPGQGPGGAASG